MRNIIIMSMCIFVYKYNYKDNGDATVENEVPGLEFSLSKPKSEDKNDKFSDIISMVCFLKDNVHTCMFTINILQQNNCILIADLSSICSYNLLLGFYT